MLVSEYFNIIEKENIDFACAFLIQHLQYLEIAQEDFIKGRWKQETGEELIIPEEKKSTTTWYYEVYKNQQDLSTKGDKPIDIRPINNKEDIRKFLKDMYNLDDDDVIDQWGFKM